MKKNLFLLCALCVISACDNSSALSSQVKDDGDLSFDAAIKDFPLEEADKYSTEELLGKTIEEYELFEREQNNQAEAAAQARTQPENLAKIGFAEIDWDDLITPGYDADSIIKKYDPLIAKLEHGTDDALKLYQKMEEEFNNAPANPELADKKVSIPGFIAPLEQLDGMITEFLLVPYFGACIHMPPPPSNQTMYVKVAAEHAIRNEDSYDPIWVSGKMGVSNTSTDIGSASYQIQDAIISKYN